MFLFAACQIGAESALKKEIARACPALRFAYSRPGFLTFKNAGAQELTPAFELQSIFARAYGMSLGKATSPLEVFEHAEKLNAGLKPPGTKPRLHVFERDAFAPDEAPKDFRPDRARDEALALLKKDPRFVKLFSPDEAAKPGDLVLDLIHIEGQPGETQAWWIGAHRHSPSHSPFAGGDPRLPLPPEAPSRAYLKLEEALRWPGAPMREGDTVVEIGSAPGGASYALLKRGLNVIGIDPAEMDQNVMKYALADSPPPHFLHIAKPAAHVERRELPDSIQWILLDMNVAPNISLNTVERIAPAYADSLLGVILTLKLNDWKFTDEIPKLLRRVEKLGMIKIRPAQLASNKQEFCVVALTRKGSVR